MDKTAKGIGGDQAEEPEDEQNHKEGPEHSRALSTESLQETPSGRAMLGDSRRKVNEELGRNEARGQRRASPESATRPATPGAHSQDGRLSLASHTERACARLSP